MLIRLLIFLLLNFGALGIGGLFTAAQSEWYLSLDKAPWTPPGWVFGAAWTTIMICFSVYMAYWWEKTKDRKTIIGLYTLQWILNVGWNPLFFYFHQVSISLLVILSLTSLIIYLLVSNWSTLRFISLWILPYFIWLVIASSLNGYVVWFN